METQASVVAWCRAHFPKDSPKDRIRMLMEEASELAVASGEISLEEALDVVGGVWRDLGHLPKGAKHVVSGIADVQIALYAIADDGGYAVQDCLEEKMRRNRRRMGA